jgi:hypothetical protein
MMNPRTKIPILSQILAAIFRRLMLTGAIAFGVRVSADHPPNVFLD